MLLARRSIYLVTEKKEKKKIIVSIKHYRNGEKNTKVDLQLTPKTGLNI